MVSSASWHIYMQAKRITFTLRAIKKKQQKTISRGKSLKGNVI